MLFCTNYNNEECEWKEMVLDEVEVAFRYDFTVHISGAYFFMTCFKQYVVIFLFYIIYRYDEDNIKQKQEGPIIRFVVLNEVVVSLFQLFLDQNKEYMYWIIWIMYSNNSIK